MIAAAAVVLVAVIENIPHKIELQHAELVGLAIKYCEHDPGEAISIAH